MHIDMQVSCEQALNSHRSKVFAIQKWGTEFMMDVQDMTQVNCKYGKMRKMRRLLCYELPHAVVRVEFLD